MTALRLFFQRHPIVRETLLWALPALVFGAVLRVLLTCYLPYALWNPDSRSGIAHRRFGIVIGRIGIQVLPYTPLVWCWVIPYGKKASSFPTNE